ncbi:MAG: hypothetical protein Q9202_004422 [Teloschistes flavicans]
MTEKKNLGFMDLPPEIRSKIYPHLLTASETSLFLSPHDEYEHHRRSCPTIVSLDSSPSPRRYRSTRADARADEEGFLFWDEPLHPSILRTCRTIYREAAPILYSTNTFSFSPPPFSPSRDDDLIFFDEPPPVATAPLATFLQVIGPLSTLQICSLRLSAPNTLLAADFLLNLLPLTLTHLPSLRHFSLHVAEKAIDWDDAFAPSLLTQDDDEQLANGPLEPMCASLREFLGSVHWLQGFVYEDGPGGQWRFVEDGALEWLKGFEECVEERIWVDEGKREERRRRVKGWRKWSTERDVEEGFGEFWDSVHE